MTDLATKPGADGAKPADGDLGDENADEVVDDPSDELVEEPHDDSDAAVAETDAAHGDDSDGDETDIAASEDDGRAAPDEDTEASADDGDIAEETPVDDVPLDDEDVPVDDEDVPADDDDVPADGEDTPVDEETPDDSEDSADDTTVALDAVPEDAVIDDVSPVLDDEPAPADETAVIDSAPEVGSDTAAYAWAPVEPKQKKSRKGLWIGIAAGVAVVGLVASSLVLIAPGTSVAGVPLGGLTAGSAADVLQQRLADTTIILTGDGGDVEVTGADLGATIDARGLADAAFAEHPMWNPTQWFSEPVDAHVVVDPATATAALRKAAPDLYVDPVDATLAYDATSATYVTTPAETGEGIDVDAVVATLIDAYDAGESTVDFDPALAPVEPTTNTTIADETAARLNGVLDSAGFYIGDERTIPIDRAVAASWLTVTRDADGTFAVSADEDAIQAVVDTLPAAVNREVVNSTVITDSNGKVLRTVTAGTAGRALGDTALVGSAFAAQLASGNGAYALPVTVQEPVVTALARRIEVNISQQRAYLFENGAVVYSYPVSSGLPGHDTNLGNFHIYAKVALQNMGDRELIKADYFTPNVPWISYFNGDEALHGAYWHNNFGHRMSHGCVNMPIDAAKLVYDWAPIGTEVWVHT